MKPKDKDSILKAARGKRTHYIPLRKITIIPIISTQIMKVTKQRDDTLKVLDEEGNYQNRILYIKKETIKKKKIK